MLQQPASASAVHAPTTTGSVLSQMRHILAVLHPLLEEQL